MKIFFCHSNAANGSDLVMSKHMIISSGNEIDEFQNGDYSVDNFDDHDYVFILVQRQKIKKYNNLDDKLKGNFIYVGRGNFDQISYLLRQKIKFKIILANEEDELYLYDALSSAVFNPNDFKNEYGQILLNDNPVPLNGFFKDDSNDDFKKWSL